MMVSVISDSWAAIIGIFGMSITFTAFISYMIGKRDGRKSINISSKEEAKK